MTTLSQDPRLSTNIADLVTAHPARAAVFERYVLEYCCGGRVPLGEVCQARQIDPAEILAALDEVDFRGNGEQINWSNESASDLADHIEQTHHAWLREELPRLRGLVEKVSRVHGDRHPNLRDLEKVFMTFATEMIEHMMKEERILFPAIRALEAGREPDTLPGGSVEGPIQAMMAEHEDSGAALERMRELTDGFTPPAQACTSYRVLFDSLHRLEADTHVHVHKENSILFPKAQSLMSRA